MSQSAVEFVRQQVELSEQLWAERDSMFEPQDLPGRYGRVIAALDHILQVINCASVMAGGWAVWRHGYLGRHTQDIDIVLPTDRIDEFLHVASVSGFRVLPTPAGRWPKVQHKDTDVQVDILPQGERPGTQKKPAPTTIPHPDQLGAAGQGLRYIHLAPLIELKLAAGRARDDADVIELVRVNAEHLNTIRQHLASVHADYVRRFDELVENAQQQEDR